MQLEVQNMFAHLLYQRLAKPDQSQLVMVDNQYTGYWPILERYKAQLS